MKTLTALLLVITGTANAAGPSDLPPEHQIEYSSPKAAYEALSKKAGIAFSKDSSGWTVAYDEKDKIIWSFAPATEPSFPIVVKRSVLEKDGSLYIAMDVMCGGSKEACDAVVKNYTTMNEQFRQTIKDKIEADKQAK
jgi:hypothetical protein